MEKIKILLGILTTYIASFLGGIDGIMTALLVFISIDYVTGVCVAIKKKQLSSEVGFWGLVKKVCIIALIGISHIIDVNVIGDGNAFRTAVALYYIGNEGVSLIENAGAFWVDEINKDDIPLFTNFFTLYTKYILIFCRQNCIMLKKAKG